MNANVWPLVLAIVLILTFITLQVINFLKTKKKIKQLRALFTNDIENILFVQKQAISIETLKNRRVLLECVRRNNFPTIEDGYEYDYVSLLMVKNGAVISTELNEVIRSINLYLCKNIGTSADFSVITDICNHAIQTYENEIQNTLNVPLYFGLAGTFSGVICGLIGVDMTAISTNTGQLQHLLWGVIGAMSASLLGLLLTIYNSAKGFKEATTINDQYKELFFDFLRQELMPVLSNTMSQSLNSLRGVLGHFVDSFGRNLDSYADSAEMLNDNLEKQHLVLQELNNLSLTKTSMRIAETFKTLDESAKSLEVFYSYHKQLNSTISNLDKTASKVDSIIEAFRDFTTELHLLAENQNTTIKLQQDFSEAINTHFPIGGEGREVWRKEFDTLIEDAQITTDQLSKQLTNSTQYIANFVDNNSEFFESLAKLNDVVDTLVKYTNIQAQSYTQLSQEFVAMRKDYKEVQNETLELSKLTIEAIKEMTKQIKDIKK